MNDFKRVTYRQAIAKLAHNAELLGGVYAAQSSERWRGMAQMVAYCYSEPPYTVVDDVKRMTHSTRKKNRW